ncbi:MAG: uroporphyrinogen decarboxylase family protein [Saccharofermentanales bacterium]
MNSRERILAAINHKEPDRVPVDLGATPSSGISAIAYKNLKKYLGITSGHTRVYDVVQQVAQPENMILDRFGIDVIDIGRAFNTLDRDWSPVVLPDGGDAYYPAWFKPVSQEDKSVLAYNKDGVLVGKMPVGATFFDQTTFPYLDEYPKDYSSLQEAMGKVVWQALAHSPWDNAGAADFWKTLREKAIELRNNSDRAIMIVCGCNLFEWGTFLRRMDNFLMDIYTEPEEVEKLLDALLEIHLATLEKVCAAVGDVVDILRFGDDLGMDSGPFMSPEIYHNIFQPRHKKLCNYVKSNSKMKTFLHSCGSIYKLLPDLIDAGYDIINPVQTTSFEMDPVKLKKEFGADITFWGGGCDTRFILNNGTPEQVRDDVKRRVEILAPGGGFVFNPIHNIMPDVPPENIVAMFDALSE